jgi:hypothetical protein
VRLGRLGRVVRIISRLLFVIDAITTSSVDARDFKLNDFDLRLELRERVHEARQRRLLVDLAAFTNNVLGKFVDFLTFPKTVELRQARVREKNNTHTQSNEKKRALSDSHFFFIETYGDTVLAEMKATNKVRRSATKNIVAKSEFVLDFFPLFFFFFFPHNTKKSSKNEVWQWI